MNIDVQENTIYELCPKLLEKLLEDKTTNKNIIWATNQYESYGDGYSFNDCITVKEITGGNGSLIQPRIRKSVEIQFQRVREKAEVFTPAWICNAQNNLVDKEWFGYENAFNIECAKSWRPTKRVIFPDSGRRYQTKYFEYIQLNRMEITCGEAPYITSRYDSTTGEYIDIPMRVGFLDRKLRVINEHTNKKNTLRWKLFAKEALKSIYAFEYQGDNLLLARENILATIIEHYRYKYQDDLDLDFLLECAEVITWNVWQMDGITLKPPQDYLDDDAILLDSFNGSYCKIMEWGKNNLKLKKKVLNDKQILFAETMRGHHEGV